MHACNLFNVSKTNAACNNGDGDAPPSNGVYILQLIRFEAVFSDYSNRNECLTAELLNPGYRYHKIRTAYFNFYRRHSELILVWKLCCYRVYQSQ